MKKMKAHIQMAYPRNKISFEEAKYPLLDNNNPLTLALCVVGIGCDVYPGGVPGVTPLSITKKLKMIKEKEGVRDNEYGKIYVHLMKFMLEKDKTTKLKELDIQTFCQAFLYQPALEFGMADDSSAYHYVFHRPTYLSPYLKMFLPPNVEAEEEENERRDIVRCKGIKGINAKHDFLKNEGHYTCSCCSKCFCRTCRYSPHKDRDSKKARTKKLLVYYDKMNEDICVDCYKEKVFLPFSSSIDDASTIEEMKDYLKEQNKAIPPDAVAHKIQEMYEICVIEEKRKANVENDVPFPLYESLSLDVSDEANNKKYKYGKILHTFPLAEGGLFISNSQCIPDEHVAAIINLMANVVRYKSNQQIYTSYNSPVYDVLPSIFLEFANGSRASSGYSLLKRCLRHSFDPKAMPIMEQKASLFIHNKDGEMGMVLENKIPASMKDVEYDVSLAFTSKDLLATRCECQAGGEKSERVVCVHALPVLYQLTMLLDDGLAEHLLVELCSRWNTELEDLNEKEGKCEQLREDIVV